MRIGAGLQRLVNQVARLFDHGTVLGRADKKQLVHLSHPGMLGLFAIVERAARHHATHAVAHDANLLHSGGPFGQQLFQHVCQRAPVFRDVQTGVVAQIQGRVAVGCRQHFAVVMAVARPLQLIHAVAVQHDQNLARRAGKGLRQCCVRDL